MVTHARVKLAQFFGYSLLLFPGFTQLECTLIGNDPASIGMNASHVPGRGEIQFERFATVSGALKVLGDVKEMALCCIAVPLQERCTCPAVQGSHSF
jgi:hypothetical protein